MVEDDAAGNHNVALRCLEELELPGLADELREVVAQRADRRRQVVDLLAKNLDDRARSLEEFEDLRVLLVEALEELLQRLLLPERDPLGLRRQQRIVVAVAVAAVRAGREYQVVLLALQVRVLQLLVEARAIEKLVLGRLFPLVALLQEGEVIEDATHVKREFLHSRRQSD